MKINYITGNALKFSIAENYFKKNPQYTLVQYDIEIPEIQSASTEEVARHAAVTAAKEIGEPCIKLDVGFSIEALGGFPGPFVKFVNDWLSEENYLALLEGASDRTAYFIDTTAIGYPDGTSHVISAKHKGSIASPGQYTPSDWPANSLFIPEESSLPLGSMSQAEQEAYWGDSAWPTVVEHLASNSNPRVPSAS